MLKRILLPIALTLFAAPHIVPAAPSTAAAAAADSSDDADWDNHDEDHNRNSGHRHHSRHDHRGDDIFNLGSDSNLPAGEHAQSVVSIFGSSTSEGEAEDVVSIFGDNRVTGPVNDSAVTVFGNNTIDGKIDGDAVAVFGNLELGPHAEIGGDVVAVGGTIHRDPAAIVHGEVQNVFTGDFGGFSGLRAWVQHCLLYARPLAFAHGLGWAWGLALSFLGLYVVLALLFRESLSRCVEVLETQPGQTVLAALLAMLFTPVLVVLLCVTVIGIAAVPFVVAGLFCAGAFGKAVVLAWLGRRVTGRHAGGPAIHPAAAALIGGALVLLLYVIPVIGFLVFNLVALLGFGAVVYTLILATRARQAAKYDRASAASSRGAAPLGGAPGTGSAPAAGTAPADTAAASIATSSTATFGGAAPAAAADPPPQPQPPPPPPPPSGQAQAAAAPRPAISAALPHAGFWIRMAALLIDFLLLGVVTSMLHAGHLHLLVLAAYGAVMWKLRGSTVGGIVFDLHVVRLDGRQVDWETAIIRALGCFLSFAVAGLGFFWIAFDDAKQAWHDKIAGTVVVRVPKGAPLV
jgi:uncharacterized RDD family membrane protein YckC